MLPKNLEFDNLGKKPRVWEIWKKPKILYKILINFVTFTIFSGEI